MRPFNPRSFLADRAPLALLAIACSLGVFAMARTLGLGAQPAAIMAGFVALCALVGFVVSYLSGRRFFQDAPDLAEHIDKAYQLPELIERPHALEGRIAFDLCDSIARLDATELTQERSAAARNEEFFGLWVHEVKTPLAASRLILDRMHGEDAVNLRRELDRIDASCERALFGARIASISADYQIVETALLPVCREACRDLASLLIEHHIKLEFNLPADLAAPTDHHWMKFVIKQALTNSAKYGAQTITFDAETLDENTPHGKTVLHITDDGIGIPESDMPNVFRQGFSGSNGRADGSSTGMGLYLAAQTCAAMGASLSLTSEEGTGTAFSITLPHNRDATNMTKA